MNGPDYDVKGIVRQFWARAPDLWHELPKYPRYLVTGKKTAATP
ncbi:MAG: hypothetical protein JWN15_1693 [Firmicutes bacterium]|nr:hypothetical protein [Bacillota bacterium]